MADNPFYVAPPNILQALLAGGQAYNQGRDRQRDERNELAKLLQIREDRAFRQQEAQRSQSNADRQFGLQRDVYNRREEPENIRTLKAAGIDPASPEGRKALFPKTDTPISATDKKAIFSAEDEKPVVQGTLETLGRALELNKSTYSGYGAGTMGNLGSKLPNAINPFDQNKAKATLEWQKMMSPEALQTMADTLKGATTDFELKKFTEMLADPETPPEIRERVIGRLQTLAQRKMEIIDRRTKELRGGDYFKPQGAQPAQPSGAPIKVTDPAQRDALPPGTRYIAPDGSLRTKQ